MSILLTVRPRGIVADGLARPLVGDLFRGEIGVPREAAEGVEIGEGQRRAEPCMRPMPATPTMPPRAEGRLCRRRSV